MRMPQSRSRLSCAPGRRASIALCRAVTAALCAVVAPEAHGQAVTAPPAPTATSSRVTSPKEQFGFAIGDDYQLATYEQLTAYWRRLD